MATIDAHPTRKAVWRIASRQYDRITYQQLLELGLTPGAVRHRVAHGRLTRVAPGVYAVSRPRGTPEERWMEDILRCPDGAVLDNGSAAALWGLESGDGPTEISVPAGCLSRLRGVVIHRRSLVLPREARRRRFIPVTSPALTLIDNATRWGEVRLEAAINKADGLGIARPDSVRAAAERYGRVPGASLVRTVLDRLTFELTDSELERRFRRLLREASLPQPLTQQWVNGCRVDFFWPDMGLVVEADSLRYHRTASQQRSDRRRDRTHTVSGLETLRFTHYEISFEQDVVKQDLATVIELRRRQRAA